ncbi:MAG TPA: NUDIX hydrolase [Tenericutes bacterium]|nr:NUDIX hydrolase [Mycoplasmatota bacterium]
MQNRLQIKIETNSNIFTIEKGQLKVLLEKRKNEPFKGYWALPTKLLEENISLEDNNKKCIIEKIGNFDFNFFQTHTFSDVDRIIDQRVISTSFIGTIDNITINLKQDQIDEDEYKWFYINQLPKIAYDHEKIINFNIGKIKEKIINSDFLKRFYPSDFTLPELQLVYEDILKIEIDRRNFRKKLINMDMIEDTGYKNDGGNGRPAKLYRFKENNTQKNLF